MQAQVEEWSEIQQQLVQQIKDFAFNRPSPVLRPPQMFHTFRSSADYSSIRLEEDDLPQLKNHRTHVWILVHNSNDKVIKNSSDYKEFKKMYERSKYLKKRCCVHVNKLHQMYNELQQKLGLLIKCYIHSEVVLQRQLWERLKPTLQRDLIGEIVVKSKSETLSKREYENKKCLKLFQNEEILKNRYSGLVLNFQETIQQEKRLMNLVLSKLKPNFFIINQYETVEASTNLNSFHDILINTKAYLKESFDITEKSKVKASLSVFRQFIYEQFDEKYKLMAMQGRQDAELKKKNERNILRQFFQFTQKVVNNSYPFPNSEVQNLFYDKIILLYTCETVVYSSVNNLCKTVTSKEMFMKIAFFCKFLNLAIKKKGRNDTQRLIRGPQYRERTFYRGAMMSEVEWNSLIKMAKTNGFIINLAFTSTSISQQVALKFYKNTVRNNILIKIKINSCFERYYDKEPYCKYLQYFIINNVLGISQEIHEEEVIFNCFNVFKVISYVDKQKETRVLVLEAFSHLQIIEKKQQGQSLTPEEQRILDVIVRIQKDKDYAQQLKQQGKTVQMVNYLEKIVENGVDLNVDQAQSYIQFMVQNNKQQNVEKIISKIQENNQLSIQQEMKLAVYETIKQEFLQSEIYLQSINEKLIKSENLMEKSILKDTMAVNKEKVGAYEQCIALINENLQVIHPEMQVCQFIESIETWAKFYEFLIKHQIQQRNAKSLLKMHTQFTFIHTLSKEKKMDNKAQRERVLAFLQKTQAAFFLSFYDRFQDQQTKQIFINERQLRKDLQSYKCQFYKRSKMKVKILIYNYEILIKSERIELSKEEKQKRKNNGSQVFRNLFELYFENNKKYFQQMYKIYLQEKSNKFKYDKAMFLKEYGKFLSGYSCFSKISERQKTKNRQKIAEVFSQARSYLLQIYSEHEQLASIQNIEDNIRQERIFSQKLKKINSICQSIDSLPNESNSINNESELVALAESIKLSRVQSAKRFSRKNSFLNENLCYSSVLSMTIEVAQNSILSSSLREKYNLQFQRLASKIESNTNSNVYLKQHTSNAFNEFLRASFEYYRGSYEAAMVFIGKSEQILDNKLRVTQLRIANEHDETIKDNLRKKIETIKQNNQVRIKICILKSKICINYKPNIHQLCIRSLFRQRNFIREKLFEHNSALPQLYYHEAYLKFTLNQADIDPLSAALTILLPRDKRSIIKKDLLKYYTLKYILETGTEKIEDECNIQEVGRKSGVIVSSPNKLKIELLEDHEHYYFFKMEQRAEQNQFSLYQTIQRCFNIKARTIKLDKVLQSQQIMSLFVADSMLYWQIIESIIHLKFDNSMLVSYRLFAAYFMYIQYLISVAQADNKADIFDNLRRMSLKLAVIVENSEESKRKFGIELNSNGGYEDKITIILLHVYKYTYEHRKQIPANNIIIDDHIYEEEYKSFRSKHFSNVAELDQYLN